MQGSHRTGKWQKWLALDRAQRLLFVRAYAHLQLLRWWLPLLTFRPQATTAVTAGADSQSQQTADRRNAVIAQAQAIARIVQMAAAQCPPSVACLHRSTVLWHLLRAHELPCSLRIGARSGNGPFGAHAWVECDGAPLSEATDVAARFSAFAPAVVPSLRRPRWRSAPEAS